MDVDEEQKRKKVEDLSRAVAKELTPESQEEIVTAIPYTAKRVAELKLWSVMYLLSQVCSRPSLIIKIMTPR